MTKKFYILCILLLCFQNIFGQSEDDMLLMYKKMIEKSDSLKTIGKISEFDSKKIETIAKKLDKEYPIRYFEASRDYFKNSMYNESAFLYHLGKMRTADFNKNEEAYYEPTSDIGVFLEEGIFIYLATDIDNYNKILKMAVGFYNKNDYTFISKNKNYHKLINPTNYSEIIEVFETKRAESAQELKQARDEMTSKVYEYLPLLENTESKNK